VCGRAAVELPGVGVWAESRARVERTARSDRLLFRTPASSGGRQGGRFPLFLGWFGSELRISRVRVRVRVRVLGSGLAFLGVLDRSEIDLHFLSSPSLF
jgi:hypothetical protein